MSKKGIGTGTPEQASGYKHHFRRRIVCAFTEEQFAELALRAAAAHVSVAAAIRTVVSAGLAKL